MKNRKLEIQDFSFAYGKGKPNAASHVNLHVDEGEFVGILGPNGSGKSTILKNVYRALKPKDGQIFLDGKNLNKMSFKESARKMAVVSQENEVPFDFKVEEIVAMGRSCHHTLFELDNEHDRYMIHHALEHLGMENMAQNDYASLSGGEKQRVLFARALAQESDFLILDEPTNHLDISYQIQMFDLVKRLHVTVLSAIHDLNMAALYCDRIYVMKNGKVVLEGKPEDVLTPSNIRDIYGVESIVQKNPETGKLAISYIPEGIV